MDLTSGKAHGPVHLGPEARQRTLRDLRAGGENEKPQHSDSVDRLRLAYGVRTIALPKTVSEAASVKPAITRNAGSAAGPRSTGAPPASPQGDPILVIYAGIALKDLLIRAYGLRSHQIVGPS